LILIITVIVVVLVAAGVGVWLLLGNKKPAQSAASSSQTAQDSAAAAQASNTPKTFKSTTLNIEFTYPGAWKMRENADKSQIMLTSPQVTYQKSGVSTQGVFTLKMRTSIVPQAMQTTLQNISAVKKSEVIAYASPTEQQRQYTSLSFGGKGTNMSLLMVTGGSEFLPGDTFASGLDLQGAFYLFAGGYGSDPNDSLTFDSVPLNSFVGTSAYAEAVDIIKSVKVY
jgi:cellobiose-specific phosphotransferase system component IIB